jgi:error-prone DNA polymerase
MGLAIVLPDINASEWAYHGTGDRLRIGLMQVKGLTKALGMQIVEERTKNGLYRSWRDFLTRVDPEPAQARLLIRAGCCDSLAGELTRPALLWRLYAHNGADPLPVPDEYPPLQKLAHELESFGFLVSRHPLVLYRTEIERLQPVPAAHMRRFVGRRITMVGWLITEKPVETKHGQAMEFITLEDTTALYDATLFPEVYQRCHSILSPNRPYVVRGRVEEEFGVATLTVSDLHVLEPTSGGGQPSHRRSPAWYGDECDPVPIDPPPAFSPPT